MCHAVDTETNGLQKACETGLRAVQCLHERDGQVLCGSLITCTNIREPGRAVLRADSTHTHTHTHTRTHTRTHTHTHTHTSRGPEWLRQSRNFGAIWMTHAHALRSHLHEFMNRHPRTAQRLRVETVKFWKRARPSLVFSSR